MVNNEQKTKIQLEVYDELIEVNIIKGEEEKGSLVKTCV